MLTHRHGSPFDRGAADSYYRRPRRPHYYKGGSYQSERVEEKDMTQEEIMTYNQGFFQNEKEQNFKDYGFDYDYEPNETEELEDEQP